MRGGLSCVRDAIDERLEQMSEALRPARRRRQVAARLGRAAGRSSRATTTARERRYVVDMFSYPSGDLHMGHAEAFSIGDAVARYAMMRGYDVLHPIGWDSFGLPAENAALKRDMDPREWTYENIEVQAESFKRLGISFDWRTRLHTSDPEYYRWTQWLFLRFYERGLAYRKAAPVNWCPNDQTVLANEQVIAGKCERCGTRGHEEEPDPVVLPHHRLCRPAAGRHGPAGRQLARPRADDAAQLDRPLHRRLRRLPRSKVTRCRSGCSRPDRTRCSARRSSSSPRTRRWLPSCARDDQRDAFDGVRRPGPQRHRHRAAVERPAQDRCLAGPRSRSTRSTASASRCSRPTTCWPTTAPARSWPCPRTTSATWTSRAPSTCRCASSSTPASPDPNETGIATSGDGVLVNSGSYDGCARRGDRRRSPRTCVATGTASRRSPTGCATGCCRGSATGAARSRSCTAARAVRSPSRTTSCRWSCRRPATSCGPKAAGHRWRARPTGSPRLPEVRR